MPFSLFTRTPPPVEADAEPMDPGDIRNRLAAMPSQRRSAADAHNAATAPLVARRDRLAAELQAVDDELATLGERYRDAIRHLDHEHQRLVAMLPPGELQADAEDNLEAADPKAVRKLLQKLRDDPDERARLVPATAVQIAAADQYDAEEAEILAWGRQAVQAMSATGEADPDNAPECIRHWPKRQIELLTGVQL